MLNELVVPSVEKSSLRITTPKNPISTVAVCDWHFHNEYELLLALEGTKVIITSDAEYSMQRGDVLFINRKVPHKTITYPDSRTIMLQFKNPFSSDDAVNHFISFRDSKDTHDVLLFRADSEHCAPLKAYITDIVAEYTDKKPAYEEFIRGYLAEMVAYFYRHRIIAHHSNQSALSEVQRIMPALEYINTHYHEPITLDSISKQLLIDRSHFCRLFKKSTNMTFIDYINSMRIYHAEQLLIKTQISITEISFQVGFSSTAYFIKVFKRYNLCTPSNYRKMFLASRNSQ